MSSDESMTKLGEYLAEFIEITFHESQHNVKVIRKFEPGEIPPYDTNSLIYYIEHCGSSPSTSRITLIITHETISDCNLINEHHAINEKLDLFIKEKLKRIDIKKIQKKSDPWIFNLN